MKFREGHLTLEELLLDIRKNILRGLKYEDVPTLTSLKEALTVIQGAAGERGDQKVVQFSMDMQSAIIDYIERGDTSSYIPSVETIKAALSSAHE
jgi:hypothetical protein